MKIAVLIPCYNEEVTIEKVVKDFKKELKEASIYVYDNNSKDKTKELAQKAGAIVVPEYKQGKGSVVRSMFYDIDADIYIMVDGDDTYPASTVHELIKPVIEGRADMAIGDRLSNGTYKNENKRIFHDFGNNLVKNSINKIFKADVKDIMTGYRVFNRKFVKNMPVMSPNFEIETEMTLYALDKRLKIVEIPIEYRDRPEGSVSKLNTIKDGIKVLKTIKRMFRDYKPLKYYLVLFIFFMLISIVGALLIFLLKTRNLILIGATAISFIASIICLIVGLVLNTLVRQNRENYELNLLRFKQIEDLNDGKN